MFFISEITTGVISLVSSWRKTRNNVQRHATQSQMSKKNVDGRCAPGIPLLSISSAKFISWRQRGNPYHSAYQYSTPHSTLQYNQLQHAADTFIPVRQYIKGADFGDKLLHWNYAHTKRSARVRFRNGKVSVKKFRLEITWVPLSCVNVYFGWSRIVTRLKILRLYTIDTTPTQNII